MMKFTLFVFCFLIVTVLGQGLEKRGEEEEKEKEEEEEKCGCKIETFQATVTTLVPAATTTITTTATVTPTFKDVGCYTANNDDNNINLVAQGISYQKTNNPATDNPFGYTATDCLNDCLANPNAPFVYFCLSFSQTPTTANFYCNCREALPPVGGTCQSLTIRGIPVEYGVTTDESSTGDVGTEECYQLTS